MPTSTAQAPRPRSAAARWLRRLVGFGALALLASVGVGLAVYAYFERDLPSVDQLRNYHPPQVTKVYCGDGSLCAEFFKERRTWVDVRTLPPHVKNAFLAAEDADFYNHEGLDYLGMVRAALKAVTGGHVSGASTITQQAVKNLLLTQERTLSRKIREWILTPRLEKTLSKDEILNLYVNSIYFGHQRYGVEEAALFYFGKHARDLSVGEAAVLGGIPQSPTRINPLTNMVKAKRRQQYVLHQLAAHGFLSERVVTPELDKPIVLAAPPPAQTGPYYVEEVRRALVARYGETTVNEGGLRVEIAMIPKLQAAADEAVQRGLEAVDRRMGFQGPLGTLTPERFAPLSAKLRVRISEMGKRKADEVLVADLSRLVESAPVHVAAEGVEEKADQGAEEQGEAPSTPDDELVRQVPLLELREGLRLAGYVAQVDDKQGTAEIDLVGRKGRIPFSTCGWARPRSRTKWTAEPKRMSEVLQVGQLVRVKVVAAAAGAPLGLELDQVPEVQGALVSIDPPTRRVVAMTGGYDFQLSPFNRATQAQRQPGSAFKPFLYAAALDSKRFTTTTVLNDAPETVRDPWTGKVWKPQNYEKGGYDGPMTLRQALTESKNTISVRLIEAITPKTAIEFAQRAGIHSELPENLTLALGTGEVSVVELANAYATLQSQGRYADAITLIKVTDGAGRVLESHEPVFSERISPAVAYLTTSMMQSVVEEGTAMAVRELGRPAAGKTGTASEYRDAWFAGYTPDLIATSWVGFDDHSAMNKETGAKAALPLWLAYMKVAMEDVPKRDFEVPQGVQLVRIDPSTGLLAGSAIPGRTEPFLEGTVPTLEAPAPGTVRPEDFFMQDQRGGR